MARPLAWLVVVVGIALALTGFYAIAEDLWPDGEYCEGHFLGHVLFFIVPGLVAMGVGARIGRRRG